MEINKERPKNPENYMEQLAMLGQKMAAFCVELDKTGYDDSFAERFMAIKHDNKAASALLSEFDQLLDNTLTNKAIELFSDKCTTEFLIHYAAINLANQIKMKYSECRAKIIIKGLNED